MAEALAANVRALADTGGKVRDLAAIPLPISAQSLVEAYAEDREKLATVVGDYHRHRSLIDDTLADAL